MGAGGNGPPTEEKKALMWGQTGTDPARPTNLCLTYVLWTNFTGPKYLVGGKELNFLSELREFSKALKEVFTAAPSDALIVVIVGLLVIGGAVGWYAHKAVKFLFRKVSTETEPPQTDPPQKSADVRRLLVALEEDGDALWRFHATEVPYSLLKRLHEKLRIVTFTNLKGGVGKTTLTANLAAYFHEQNIRVLLIDFDYQGSLSAAVLKSVGREAYSEADRLLSGALTAAEVVHPARRLTPQLERMTLIPAEYKLSQQENRLLMRWLLEPGTGDPRYSLARLLNCDEILDEFRLVLVDTPPRLGLATLNGLCASTHVVIPAILNPMSIGNVRGLLDQLDRLFIRDLNPGLKVAGIVAAMTTQINLTRDERLARLQAEEAAQVVLGPRAGGLDHVRQLSARGEWPVDAYVFAPTIPSTVRFPREGSIAYLNNTAQYQIERNVIDALGAELAQRIGL